MNTWFQKHVDSVLNPPRSEYHEHHRIESRRHCHIQRADLHADIGGGSAHARVESNPAQEATKSGDGDDDGGDGDSDPAGALSGLSAANLALQQSFFRTTKTSIPGVRFCLNSGAFKAQYVHNGKPTKLGSFATLNEAADAIVRAYVMQGAA